MPRLKRNAALLLVAASTTLAALSGMLPARPDRTAFAATGPFYRMEAEAMTPVGTTSRVSDAAASGGVAIKAWNNLSGVSGSALFPTVGTYTFTFGGREDYYGGTTGTHAHVSLYLDSATTPAGGVYVTNTTNYPPYSIAAPLAAGTHTFRLLFDNDAYGGSGSKDRNAYLDYVSIAAPGGTTYYLDCASGADSNSGTSASAAWRSLGKASGAPLAPGDSLLLKRGCTWSGTLTVSRSGTASQNILVGAYGAGALPIIQTNVNGGADVALRGAYITVDSLFAQGIAPSHEAGCQNQPKGWIAGFDFQAGAHDDTVSNAQATGLWAGANVESGSYRNHILNNQFVNNTMMWPLDVGGPDDSGAFGVALHGDNNEVAHNTITGSDACSYDHGRDGSAVEVYGGQNNTVRDNIAQQDKDFTELGNSRSANNTFAYNLYSSTLSTSIFLTTRGAQDTTNGPVLGTKAYNNTVYLTGSSSQGFVCYDGCSGTILRLRNNIMQAAWKAGYADAPFDEDYDLFWQGAQQFTLGAHSKVANPLFVSPSGQDFRLQPGSPAIGAGVGVGYTTDLTNAPVPASSPDMGAYQHQP